MVNMIKEEIQIMEVEDDQPLMFNLVPPEVLLDVFSFTSGIKLSQLKTVHQQFKKLIENYSKTLPDMTVQQLVITLNMYQKRIQKKSFFKGRRDGPGQVLERNCAAQGRECEHAFWESQ
jgi:hypothetical protein